MPVSADQFKAGLGSFGASVTVVTTLDPEGKPTGLTVTAFSALSKSPPLVLVCIGHAADAHPSMKVAPSYAVNILHRDQQKVAMQFATHGCNKFEGIAHHFGEKTGVPLLNGALACLECRVVSRSTSGDHDIIVGSVEHVEIHSGEPLIYFRGGFHDLVPH